MQNKEIRFMSVCSGIEAASVAWGPLGWEAVAFAEIDKAASAVLAHHHPDVPNLGDFTNVDTTKLGRIDVLCGGTPCQAFSIAGARASLADARGNLTLAFVGLAHELAGLGATDGNGLRNVVWENVPGVLSTIDNAFGCFLGGLVGAHGPFVPVERKPADGKSTRWWRWSEKDKVHAVAWPNQGMVTGPKGRAAWLIKDAQYFGLAQRRERVLVVADFGNGADPAAVLFERVGMQGNIAPSREAGEGFTHATAPSLTASGRGVERSGESRGQDPVVAVAFGGNNTAGPINVATARNACNTATGRLDFESETFLVQAHAIQAGALRENPSSGPDGVGIQEGVAYTLEARAEVQAVCVTGTVTHTLTNEGADASEGGTGRGTPIIAFDTTQITSKANRSNPKPWSPCHPLAAGAHAPAICFSSKDYGADATYDLAPTPRAGGHTTSHANAGVMPAIAFPVDLQNVALGKDVTGTLDTTRPGRGGGQAVLTSAVRRLTPRECERLQGFPDDYTRIPVRKTPKKVTRLRPEDMWELIDGEWWLMASDGPRYKQLGNSWAVPKFRWLGGRIQRLMPRAQATAANDNQERAIAAA